jgi:hypothetical protein
MGWYLHGSMAGLPLTGLETRMMILEVMAQACGEIALAAAIRERKALRRVVVGTGLLLLAVILGFGYGVL